MDFSGGNQLISGLIHKSNEWHAQRLLGIGGSDAGKIMSGEWTQLWREKTGAAEPEDLSNNLAVAMGTWTEALNRYWFEQVTGIPVVTEDEPIISAFHPFMRANLDGQCHTGADRAVFEAKHVGAYIKDTDVVSRYYPQCQHLMAVTGFGRCYLSVFFGSNKWEYFNIDRDDPYISELIEREADFWGYVERREAPPDVGEAPPVEIAFDAMREVDLSTSNAWANFAAEWCESRAAAKVFEAAAKELKAMVEPDVKLAYGAGIQISRSKAGSLTIKETK